MPRSGDEKAKSSGWIKRRRNYQAERTPKAYSKPLVAGDAARPSRLADYGRQVESGSVGAEASRMHDEATIKTP